MSLAFARVPSLHLTRAVNFYNPKRESKTTMTIRLSTGLRNALAGTQGFAGALANGVIDLYTGPQPVDANSPATGTLLATVSTNGAAFTPGNSTGGLNFAAAANGMVTKNGTWAFSAVASGTVGWFRFRGNAADNGLISTTLPRMDGSVATSGADMNLSNMSLVVGPLNTIDNFSFAVPAQ